MVWYGFVWYDLSVKTPGLYEFPNESFGQKTAKNTIFGLVNLLWCDIGLSEKYEQITTTTQKGVTEGRGGSGGRSTRNPQVSIKS